MDVEGGPLSGYLPLFIGRTEADAYDRIMMRRTFPNQRGLVNCQDYLTARSSTPSPADAQHHEHHTRIPCRRTCPH